VPSSNPPKRVGRRTFVKAAVAIGAVLSILPFVPWGDFLSHTVGSSGTALRQKVVVDNNPKYGAAAGKQVNVNDLSTFPPTVTYGSSDLKYTSKDTSPNGVTLTLNPQDGYVGTNVSVQLIGSGYKPGAKYNYCFEPGQDSQSAAACSTTNQFVADSSGNIPNGTRLAVQPVSGKAIVVVSDASGSVVSLAPFYPDPHWVITYPSSGNPTQDAQNPDTFVKFELIRLPAGDLGGDSKDAAAFVAFSKVCVHLWCSPNYNPLAGHEEYECPCHGSIYEIPDGKAVQGPASQQPPPTNAIPMLTLTADSNGDLQIEIPVWDLDHNGVIGYGRDYTSYQDYIKPAAEGTG
jgi:rieske iron-sulfur protein